MVLGIDREEFLVCKDFCQNPNEINHLPKSTGFRKWLISLALKEKSRKTFFCFKKKNFKKELTNKFGCDTIVLSNGKTEENQNEIEKSL
jgi:hypothetical protein